MMKLGIFLSFFGSFLCDSAQADELLCASKKDQSLYYSTGQIKVRAEINSPTLLSALSLKTTGSSTLGLSEDVVKGKVIGNWVRFQGSDAWCDYTLALSRNFMTKEESFPLFLDARCEEKTNTSIRLNCKIE